MDLEGRCTFASGSAGPVLGYEAGELLGEDVHQLIHHTRADGSHYPAEECPVHATLRTGSGYRAVDEVFWRKDGGSFPAECSSHPIVEGGEVRGAFVVLVNANERGRIDAARRTGEERFRALTEAATDGILVSEEDGTISSANDAAGRIFGYGADELVGKKVAELMPERFRRTYEATLARYLETGERAHPWRSVRSYALRADGAEVPVEISYGELSIGGRRSFIELYRDVTAWEEAEELRTRYAAILEATTDLVGTADAEGRLLSLNRAGRRMLGIGEEEDISGTRIFDYHPAWAWDVVSGRALPAAARDGSWSGETALVGRDGAEIPVSQVVLAHKDPGGEVRFFSTIARDVTGRMQDERRLAYYAMLLENVGDTVVATDENLIVTAWNRGAEKVYGRKAEEVIGLPAREVTPLDLTPEKRAEVLRQLDESGQARFEVTAYHEDGSPVEIEGLVVVLRDDSGQTSGYLSIGRDVTERKRAEESVRETLRYARRYSSQLRGLAGAALAINSARSVDELLETITARARGLVGARRATTSLTADDGSGEATTTVSRANGDAGHPTRVTSRELEVRREEEEEISASLTGRDGEELGSIRLWGKQEGRFDEVDRAVLSQLAQLAAVALENARLYRQARSAIDSLSARIAILDETGTIVAVNKSWREFAVASGAAAESVSEGANYLEVSDASAAQGSADAAVIAEGIRAVMAGRQESFEMEYPCFTPSRRFWFVARVTRFPDLEPPHLVVAHEDVTEHKRASESMLEIREAERRRLARDLHDVVLQDIAGAVQGLQAVQVERGSQGVSSELGTELEALRRSVGKLRDVIYDLRSEKERRFARAVESLVEFNRQAVSERELRLEVEEGFPDQLPDVVAQELLRVVQEALVNVRRHSEASRVAVVLGVDEAGVRAEISDDGKGFDPDEIGDGFGLSGMRERVLALGGRLDIRSAPGEGTRVEARVPI